MRNHTLVTLFKNHGAAIGTWEGWTEGPMVYTSAAKTLTAKAVQNCYEAIGKNIGKANETQPEEQAVLELEAKARLKLDKGYVKDIADAKAPATNALDLPLPMLATPLEKVKPEKINWNTAYAQPKLDGHRALFKDGVLYSRQGKVLNLPHILNSIREAGLDDLHLDGELYIHGKPLQDVSRLIKKYTDASLEVQYHIYDIVCDKPFTERHHLLAIRTDWMSTLSCLQPVDTVPVQNMESLMVTHGFNRGRGYEGTMLRFSNDGYQTGKRSRTLLKLKEFHDAEFLVVDYEEGKPYIKDTGTYRVPVWVCEAANGQRFNVTAEGNMFAKHEQWEHRDLYLERLLTVKYHYLSKEGIPQLPIAMRWREDV